MCKKINILIVDDEKINIEYVSKLLENNYNIKVALNGEQALKILGKVKIDLVLLDIHMPIMDGYETIQKIKKNQTLKDIPIIFLTSNKDDDTLIKVFKLGASDYISKPFNKEELKVRIQTHLNNYALQKKLTVKIKQINSILNEQNHIVILLDGPKIEFANKMFYDFFGYDTLENFYLDYDSICELFIEEDKFFHYKKTKENPFWADVIIQLTPSEQNVKILSTKSVLHVFSLNLKIYEEDKYLITFTDISDTILTQIALEEKIIHDKLTGAFNREYFEQNYDKLIKSYSSKNNTFALAMLDLDKFKIVNDTYGHEVGDDVLIHFVKTLDNYSREEDILIRWGGEEFILLLKVRSESDLEKALSNLRKVIEVEKFSIIKKQTCSIGATLYRKNENIKNTIRRADEAVYKAKAAGRNRVVLA